MSLGILVADASGARIFAMRGRSEPLDLVRELQNPQGRSRTQELTSDQPGRVSKAGAPGTRSAMAPHTTAHDEAAEEFAREVAEVLRHQLDRGSYTSLALVAPPRFLGLLRPLLGKEVEQRLRASLARDLVHVAANELRPHIESLFAPGVFD